MMNRKNHHNQLRFACAGVVLAIAPVALGQTTTHPKSDTADTEVTDAIENLLDGLLRRQPAPVETSTDGVFREIDAAKADVGKLLFYDKILSGNMNISCATCHHGLAGTGDGLSLSVGEGASGLGVTRDTGVGADAVPGRVPRNAPPVYNLGAHEFTDLYHDGRVAIDPSQPSGFLSPAGNDLPHDLENVLAAQAMFPVQSGTEMAGQPGENSVADAAAIGDLAGPSGVWAQLAARVAGIPEYVSMLSAAFDDVNGAGDIRFSHIANAIAAYEGSAFRADNSPYDRYLAGDRSALSQSARHGMRLFYGAAGCSDCHSGRFQTDHQFHAIAMPQIGPGKGDNLPGFTDGRDDFGRERVTGDTSDRFKFRTPSLRNVALSGPWGHSGAYESLEAVVRHHLDPVNSLLSYDESQLDLPKRADLDAIDLVVMNDPARVGAIASASDLSARNLNDVNLERLMDFLHALTDPASLDVRHTIPRTVPSGLPVFD